MTFKTNPDIAVAACIFPISEVNGNAIQLFPAGKFTAPEGALQGEGPWHLDAQLATSLISALSANKDILIDYDHQSLLFTKNQKPLDVAGTFAGADLQWRENAGLFASNVQWAATAKANFSSGKFLYVSPLFSYDKASGAVKHLISVAVTDNPAIKNMQAIELAAASLNPRPKEDTMNKDLLKLLDLTENATDDEVIAACKKLQASAETLTGEIAALKEKNADKPDPAKFVPVETMAEVQSQLAALTTQVNTDKCNDLIIAALSDGRLIAAQKSWAQSLDIAALNAYLKDAQPITALKGTQTGGKAPDKPNENALDIVAAASKYQLEEQHAGRRISVAAAVAHVTNAGEK